MATAEQVAPQIGSAQVASSLADVAAGADIIWSCLRDDVAVQEVYGQLLAAGVRGKTLVDCSSISVDTTNAIAEMAQDAGATFVAMPGTVALVLTGHLANDPTQCLAIPEWPRKDS